MTRISSTKQNDSVWEEVTLPDIISDNGLFVDGDWIESKDQDPNGEVRLIQLADIGDGDFRNKSSRFLTLKRALEIKCTFLSEGDILLARMPDPLGRACIFPLKGERKYVTAVDVAIIRANNKKVNTKFLLYTINNPIYRRMIEDLESGTTRKRISRKNLSTIPFSLPSISIQNQIVSKIEELFSELDKGIESLQLAQQQLKVYRQSVLKWAFEGRLTTDWREKQKKLTDANTLIKQIQKAKELKAKEQGKKLKPLVGITEEERSNLSNIPGEWTWIKLGDHAFVTKLAGFEFTKYVKYKNEGEVPVIRAQNVSKSSFNPRNFVYVDRNIMEQLPRSRVYGGEILMVFVGAGLGNVGIVPENHEYFLGPNVAKIALEGQLINKYVFYFLTSQIGFANVSGMSKATAQGSISMANIREVSVPLTSLEEQNELVNAIESRLSNVEKMEETINQSLQQSEALRQSILKRAFEGKIL